MSSLLARLLTFAVCGGLASAAVATSFMIPPFPQAVKGTPTVVRGTVGSSYADWAELRPGDRRIFTFTEIRIGEVLKGEAPPRDLLVLRQLGGERDGVGMNVAGTARFNRGEDIVVMLGTLNSDGSYDIQNLMMGKLQVKRDEATGEEVLSGPALGAPGIHRAHGDTPDEKQPGAVWTLSRLRDLIHEQGDRPNPPDSKGNSGGAAPAKPDGEAAPTPAPALQPKEPGTTEPPPEEGGTAPRRWPVPGLVAGIILALVAGSLYLLLRSRRGR